VGDVTDDDVGGARGEGFLGDASDVFGCERVDLSSISVQGQTLRRKERLRWRTLSDMVRSGSLAFGLAEPGLICIGGFAWPGQIKGQNSVRSFFFLFALTKQNAGH
jgi:hypothetical protein